MNDNTSPDTVLPAGTRVRTGGQSYQTAEDATVIPLEPTKAQKNRHLALTCKVEPCATYQRNANRGRLIVVRMSAKPAQNLWVPACGGCGHPMTWEDDTRQHPDLLEEFDADGNPIVKLAE